MIILKIFLILEFIAFSFVFGLIMMILISAALSLKDIDLDIDDPDIIRHELQKEVGFTDVI